MLQISPIAIVVDVHCDALFANFHRPLQTSLLVVQVCEPRLMLWRPFNIADFGLQGPVVDVYGDGNGRTRV
jgi:hypothetical protein